jgi:RES domain-containing protein
VPGAADLPHATLVRLVDAHRLIASRYRPGGESVLALVSDSDADLRALFALDDATNDRLLAEHDLLPGIGVPRAGVRRPALPRGQRRLHARHPSGSRWNGPDRGAWYAASEVETSQAEVAFHHTVALAEVGRFDDSVTYDDYLSDVTGFLHDVRGGDARWAACLAPDSYVASQLLAERLLEAGSLGVVYPSVRRAGGTCVACFRPALVAGVRRGPTYRFTWSGAPEPAVGIAG